MKNSALAFSRRRADAPTGLGWLDNDGARGSSEAGTDTKAPKSESVGLAAGIKARRWRESEGGENMEGDAIDRRVEAGGVAGAKRVAKRSSISGLVESGSGMVEPSC